MFWLAQTAGNNPLPNMLSSKPDTPIILDTCWRLLRLSCNAPYSQTCNDSAQVHAGTVVSFNQNAEPLSRQTNGANQEPIFIFKPLVPRMVFYSTTCMTWWNQLKNSRSDNPFLIRSNQGLRGKAEATTTITLPDGWISFLGGCPTHLQNICQVHLPQFLVNIWKTFDTT